MRKVIESQMKFGETNIADIKFDLRSRDEIPKLLMGLQHIYITPELREEVFSILEKIIPEGIDAKNGRRGMELWKILVLGTVRLNCNWNYDKLKEIADNHRTIRQMLGHGLVDDDKTYALQTLKDNVSLFTPEILDEINQVVVKAGHNLVKKKEEKLAGKCDSFVVETNVHFPTDIGLLLDAVRKVITLIASLCKLFGLTDWRQSEYNKNKIKRLRRRIQKLKLSTSKDKKVQEKRALEIIEAYVDYIVTCRQYLEKAEKTLKKVWDSFDAPSDKILEIQLFIEKAVKLISQIERRVFQGETIPHQEKIFSIFEPHTEWINKGKAGVPQELGLRVCVLEDQYRFILHHEVMEKKTDDQVTISMVEMAKQKFPLLTSCSFDKGFWSPSNKKKLDEILEDVILPRKGRLSEAAKKTESTEIFAAGRKQHSAIESAINGLENHGLDICPDRGIDGFRRYVSFAVLARNLEMLGNIIKQREIKREKRRAKYRRNNQARYRLAA